jgi:hypothetical protein
MICTHQRVHNRYDPGRTRVSEHILEKLYTEVPELQGTVPIDIKGCDTHRIVVRPVFHRKVYSEYIFRSFNRKILANLPKVQEGYDIGNDVHVFRISDDRRWYGCCNFALDLSGSPIHRVLQATMYQSVHLYSQRRRRVRIHVI